MITYENFQQFYKEYTQVRRQVNPLYSLNEQIYELTITRLAPVHSEPIKENSDWKNITERYVTTDDLYRFGHRGFVITIWKSGGIYIEKLDDELYETRFVTPNEVINPNDINVNARWNKELVVGQYGTVIPYRQLETYETFVNEKDMDGAVNFILKLIEDWVEEEPNNE